MNSVDIWTIKTIPVEAVPADFRIFIRNKYEYRDPLGEHVYSPDSIWLGCRYLIPPGEIADAFGDVRQILGEEQCDLFTLTDRKPLLGLRHMRQEQIRILVLERGGIYSDFLQAVHNHYEYEDPCGDHLYSRESIWLGLKGEAGWVRDTYFALWKELDRYGCDLFTFTGI